jgi:HEAT repeat protein
MALTRLGEGEGLAMTRALTEHEELGVAAEALRALGHSKLPGALVPLLRTLNAVLDGTLLRAALDGLSLLGDPRAIRPLYSWLAEAPEYLHHEILVTLRSLSRATIGHDMEAWERWIEDHNPPPPPQYALRTHSADEELGLPTP